MKKKYIVTKIIPYTNTNSKIENLIRACIREEQELEMLKAKYRLAKGNRNEQ